MTPAQILGRLPDHALTWHQIVAKGLPQPDEITPGIYVVSGPSGLVYIGKSKDLNRRLGQFIGAAVGGWWLHSGGWRLFSRRRSGALSVAVADLVFELWLGQAAYDAEPTLVAMCPTLVNAAGTLPSVDLLGIDLPTLFQAQSSDSMREEVASAVLSRLVESLGKSAYPVEGPTWSTAAWRGVGCRVGQRWKFTAYLGWRATADDVEVRLWSYEDETPWFGGNDGLTATSPAELESLVRRWLFDWSSS